MRYYAIEHHYGIGTIDGWGDLIATPHSFASKQDRDEWCQDGPDYTTAAGYRESVKASHPLIRRTNRELIKGVGPCVTSGRTPTGSGKNPITNPYNKFL